MIETRFCNVGQVCCQLIWLFEYIRVAITITFTTAFTAEGKVHMIGLSLKRRRGVA